MKKTLLALVLSALFGTASATHFVGGYITYACVSSTQVEVQVIIFRDCNPGNAGMPTTVSLRAYNAQSGALVNTYNLPRTAGPSPVPIIAYDPCTTPPATICYEEASFVDVITLPSGSAPQGYWLTYTSCCRNGTITNLTNPLGQGVRYYCRVADPNTYPCNNSPIFVNWPPIVVCINTPFVWNHSAIDADGDSLAYKFCDALGQAGPPIPPWPSVNYASPYNGTYPIASNPAMAIDPVSGQITGTPNMVGQWVFNICIEEWRNGVHIGDHHREIQLNVTANCSNTSEAIIPTNTYNPGLIDSLLSCGSYTIQFGNLSTSSFTYMWDFGDPTTTNDTSSSEFPTWTYSDTGTYLVTLITNPGTACEDTDQAWAVVYPFMVPDFDWTGTMCQYTTVQFNDLSTNAIGNLTNWSWFFGDGTTSTLQNPSHVYQSNGVFPVVLIIENDIGCRDTIIKPVLINPAPPVNAGPDQVICLSDSHQIVGVGNGTWQWSPNDGTLSSQTISNPIASPIVPTTYTVVLTSFNGCENTDSITIGVAEYPVVNAGPDFTICNSSSGQMAATASDTSGISFVTWTPFLAGGGYTPTVPAGSVPANGCATWTFSATNMHGCRSTDDVTVCRNVIAVDLGPDVTVCQGDPIVMNPVSSNGLQTYSWSPAQGLSASNIANPIATPASTTNYVLTVTDTAGCTGTDNITITVNPVPTVDAGPTDSVCTNSTIQLNATGSIGVSWAWNNADNDVANTTVPNPVVTPANSKFYYVTVTGGNGCTATDSVWIEVLPRPDVQTSADFEICKSDSIKLSTTGAYAYSWIPPGTPGLGCNFCGDPWFFAYAPGVPVGPKDYVVQGVDIYGCSNRDTVTITVNPLPPIDAGPDVFICIDDTTTLSPSGAGVGGSYVWTPSPFLSCTGCTNPEAFPPTTETFFVTGTDAKGCRNWDKVKVNVFTASSIFVTSDPTICTGQSTPLSAFHPNAQSYSWAPASSVSPSTGANVTASPTTTTTYTVTVLDNNNCAQVTTVTVYVNPLPNVVASADVTICEFDSTQLDVNGAISYTWAPATWISNANVKTPNVSPPPGNTTYTVTGTDANGCENTDMVLVTVNALPAVTAGADLAICFGDTAQLDGGGASTYVWTPSTGMISPATDEDPFVNPTATQIYMVEGTDLNGCKNTDAIQVTVNPLPPVDAGPDQAICFTQGSATLFATGASTYTWSPDSSLSSGTGQTVTASPTSTTTYLVTGTDGNGCVNTDLITVTVDVLPTVTASADPTICLNDQTQVTANGAVTYAWSPQAFLSNPNISDPFASPPTTTTYIVTGTDANGCTDTDTLTVFVNPLPPVDAGPDQEICFGDTAQLDGSGALTYIWTPASSIITSDVDEDPVVNPLSTVTYIVEGTDVNGCKNTDDATVTVHALPPVNAGLDFTMYKGVCMQLHGLGAVNYTWSPPTYLSDPNIGDPMLCATAIDSLTYYLLGVDARGCENTDSITVRIIGVPDITVPTAFTPNDDGVNDEFRIMKKHNFILTSLQVFNRWGHIVFETNDITEGWDGTTAGAKQPLATYVYVIIGTDENGYPASAEGNVTLIR